MPRGVDATPPPGALRASFCPAPDPSPRDSEIRSAKETALLIIDAQNYNCTRAGALWSGNGGDGDDDGDDASSSGGSERKTRSSAEELSYFFSRLQGDGEDDNPGVIRNWVSLAAAARSAGARVVFTVMSDATGEASHAERVTSLDYRISGFRIPPKSWDAQLIDELLLEAGGGGRDAGGGGNPSSSSPSSSSSARHDLFLPKTSCNVFLSTALDFHLRSIGARQLVVCGVVTDQCVATAVATAADLGYLVTLAEDACAATSAERHGAALRTLRGFARVRSTTEVMAELGRVGLGREGDD